MGELWTYRTRSDQERTSPLELTWEVHGDPISDDWTPEEINALDLLRLWIERYVPDQSAEEAYGPGMVRISWFVVGHPGGTFEFAPFTPEWAATKPLGNFLDYYTWPVDAKTGKRVNWLSLPVVDKSWNSKRGNKGGFIQEALGWKPAPFQPVIYLPGLLAAAGLGDLLHD